MRTTLYALNAVPAALGAAALVWLCVNRMPEYCDTPVALVSTAIASVIGVAAAIVLYPRGGIR